MQLRLASKLHFPGSSAKFQKFFLFSSARILLCSFAFTTFCCRKPGSFFPKQLIHNSARKATGLAHATTLFSQKQQRMEVGNSTRRGAFILFEGVDRCGKTTQANCLAEYLKTQMDGKAEFIRFPDRTTPIGTMINSYLTNASDMEDHSIHLLFSANRWEAVPEIKRKLEAGITLVCDRYCYSGVAFTAAKTNLLPPGGGGGGGGAQRRLLRWCAGPDRGLPAPDAVLYLDLPVAQARERGDFGGERYEKEEMQVRVRENFLELRAMDAGRTPWHVIDASGTIEDISEEIKQIASSVIEKACTTPIGKMWEEEQEETTGTQQEAGEVNNKRAKQNPPPVEEEEKQN